MIDFGQNTYQLTISFKVDCLAPQEIRRLTGDLLGGKYFATVERDQARQAIFGRGDGSEKDPLYQLRLAADSMALWVGWHVPFKHWLGFRELMLGRLIPVLDNIPVQAVRSLSSQAGTLVPNDRMKDPSKIQELVPLTAVIRRFVPEKLFGGGTGYATYRDLAGTQSLEWWFGPGNDPDHANFLFTSTHVAMREDQSIAANISAHIKESDELLQAFHSQFVPLFVQA